MDYLHYNGSFLAVEAYTVDNFAQIGIPLSRCI